MIDFAFLADTFLKLSAALPVTLGLFISSFLCGGVPAAISLHMPSVRLKRNSTPVPIIHW